jgi:DNA invertase Pin-like site-specific DNA recombinase
MTRQTQPQPPRRQRCAIYTRKSSEEGLDMEFNSLDAQREACEAYIASQKAEGWVCLRDRYDDGGFSGGTLERPALKDLIADIENGLIDIVVVYKIDRLSRALMDFSKLVEIFDKHGVTFVSVTQSFNTTTSMGRLTLNILLSFAQFEREVIGERIRDKVAASRKKGIWMGGPVPLGYNVKDRKLIVDPAEAETVRTIFTLYARSSSTAQVIRELDARAILTKTGRPYDKTSLLKTLHNKAYRGLAVHKGTAYPGEHDAIIDETLWDDVHHVIANNRVKRVAVAKEPSSALLRGLIFTETGLAMTPHHTKKGTRRYRYYVSMYAIKKRPKAEIRGPQRLPGGMVEDAVVGEIRRLLRTPEVAARVSRTLRKDRPDLGEADISASLTQFDDMWKALIPAEQARVVRLLVARVTASDAGLAVDLRHEGLGAIAALMAPAKPEVA